MIVTCPSCEAKYRVEQSALEARRGRVKCAGCAHVWTVAEAAPKPAPRPDPVPAPDPAPSLTDKPHAAIRARAATRAKRTRLAVEGAGWAGVAACLAVVMGAAFVFRVDVVEAWPRAAGAYAAVGVPVDPVGLAVESLEAELVEEDGAPVLVVEGLVRNVAGRERLTRPLSAVVLDSSGAVLAEWSLTLESPALAPGAAERFRTTFPAPPDNGARVEVVLGGAPA
ncbi:MAG: zinc-ribbon domain-containing protein [Oceanicaulis sp.]